MIGRLLEDLKSVQRVVVVDSFSSDETEKIVRAHNRTFIQNKFVNQAVQSNWLVDNHLQNEKWVLRLDSDERISKNLLDSIEHFTETDDHKVGYINRHMYWMGKKLKYSGLKTHYIGRIYQPGIARYEEATEEHLQHDCRAEFLEVPFYEDNLKNNIEYFLLKHIDTAKGEVEEILRIDLSINAGRLSLKHPHLTRRWIKLNIYNKLPKFLRPILYFFYRYFIKLGFLDGAKGFSFCFFQAFFYRMLIDQLIIEKSEKKND